MLNLNGNFREVLHMCNDKEEMDMSTLAGQLTTKKQKLWELAEKNTVRNKDGLTVDTKDRTYRKEEGWESTIKDSRSENK
jgi:hypothetical protein